MTPAELRMVLDLVAAYIAPAEGCTYSRFVELLRERVPGLEGLRYGDIYPRLFNVEACYPNEAPHYDCDAAAREVLG